MTIKAQTLVDYHNHVLKMINRKISEKEELMGIEFRKGDLKKYYKISEKIKVLEDIKEDIRWDWYCSNYSKVIE